MAVAGILVPARALISVADVALALAVVVTLAAAVGGRWSGLLSGAVAALAFDLLHVRPYGSLAISGVADALTTVLLAVVGLVAGEVAEQLHHVRYRRSTIDDLVRLRRLGAGVVRGDATDALTQQVVGELVDALELRACWYEPVPFGIELPELAADGRAVPRRGAAIPVRRRGLVVGRFVLAPVAGHRVGVERQLVSLTLVDQLAVVLAARAA